MNLRTTVNLAAGTMFAAACALAQGVTGTTTFTETFSFPPAGLALTETAQINVTNIALVPTAATATAPSCTGAIAFLNSTGATIGTATTFTVGSGQISSASLPFAKAALSGIRAEIRGVVTLTGASPSTAACSPVFSFETYDTGTGVTHVFQGNQTAELQRGR